MQTLTVEQFKDMQTKVEDLSVINVLPTTVYQEGHIPASDSIPLETQGFEQVVEEAVGDKNSPVVVYCANPSCDASPKAAKRLEEAGFKRVFDFEGGIEAWRQAGHEVDLGEGKGAGT